MPDATEELRVPVRQLARAVRFARIRPNPPRNVRFVGGVVSWDAPAFAANITHYRVYIDGDQPENLQFEVAAGQTQVVGASGQQAIVTAYNQVTENESEPVIVDVEVGLTADAAAFSFDVALYQYGTISLEGCGITGDTGTGPHSIIAWFPYVDEITSDVWATTGASMGTEATKTLTMTPNPDRLTSSLVLAFAVGDYVLINDPGKYEICRISAISGSDWTLDRSGYFGSTVVAHSSGVALFKVQLRKVVWDSAYGEYDTPNSTTFPGRFDATIANVCILAVVAMVRSDTALSTPTTTNLALADVPGVRTLMGGLYTFHKAGTLAVAAQVAFVARVQLVSSIRVIYASVGTAPMGAALIVNVRLSIDQGANWTTLEAVTIAGGNKVSFDVVNYPPGLRRVPYSGTWPFPFLWQEYLIGIDVAQVGSTVAGSDLTVEVHT